MPFPPEPGQLDLGLDQRKGDYDKMSEYISVYMCYKDKDKGLPLFNEEIKILKGQR